MARGLAIVAALALVAACGSDDDVASGGEPGPPGSAVEPSAGLERAPTDPDAPVADLAAGINDAGFELMRAQPADGNLVFSPLSIGHALLMARAAADDATAAAIDDTFGLPDGMAAHDAWNTLDGALAASNGTATAVDESETPIVTVADRVWPSTTASPDQDWIDLLATHHGAAVETIDVADGDGSRERINAWVSEQTNELIPELLPAGFIQPNTVLVAHRRRLFQGPMADDLR